MKMVWARGSLARRVLVLIGTGSCVAALIAAGMYVFRDSPARNSEREAPSPAHRSDSRTLPSFTRGPGRPCLTARHFDDLSQVTSDWTYFAGQAQPTDVWICAEGSAPFLMYGDVQVSFNQDSADEPTDLSKAAAEVEQGRVITAQDRPTWVGEGNEDKGTFTFAVFAVDGTMVNVLAQPDVPLEDVLKVANSLDLTKPID